ncbi:hypothetical protein [Nitrosomonas sp.]
MAHASAHLSPKTLNDSVDNRLKVLAGQGRWVVIKDWAVVESRV